MKEIDEDELLVMFKKSTDPKKLSTGFVRDFLWNESLLFETFQKMKVEINKYFNEQEQPIKADNENSCHQPCDPDVGCPDCQEYWNKMVSEGYWDKSRHRWTDKGWREIMK